MSSSLYIPLRDSLIEFTNTVSAERDGPTFRVTPQSTLNPIPGKDLNARIRTIWESFQSEEGSSTQNRLDVIRNVLDLVGRDIAVTPLVDGDVRNCC